MRVLVTGATGFLGGAVARRYARAGHAVTGLGRAPAAGVALRADGIAFLRHDLTAAEPPIEHELVVHCAALSAPFGPEEEFHRHNVLGTERVVAAVLRAGARLVHLSSPSVYHTGADRLDVREDQVPPLAQLTPYARSKFRSEEVARRVPGAVILRPRAIFGPGDTTLLPRIVRALAAGRLPVIGDGRTVGDLTYVDNVVDAVLLAASSARGGVFNVTNGEPVRIWDEIRALARALSLPPPRGRVPKAVALAAARALEAWYTRFRPGEEPPLTSYGVSVVATSVTLDLAAIRAGLGYAPSVSVREGIDRYVASVRA